jgi:hypothetical protein
LAGNDKIRYSKITKRMESKHRASFIRAASEHLADAVRLFEGLPRVTPD